MPDERELPAEFLDLVAAACNGALPEEQLSRLERYLTESDAAQQYFIDYLRLDAELSALCQNDRALAIVDQIAGEQLNPRPARKSRCDAPNKSAPLRIYCFFARPTPFSMSVAALVIGLLLTAMAFMVPPVYRQFAGNDASAPRPPEVQFVARLTDLYNPRWAEAGLGTDRGVYLRQGHWVALEEGLAEVTFKSGARIVIEGPARVSLTSTNSAVLERGKVVAHVPPAAIGFRLSTSTAEIVDLGTSFGAAQDTAQGEAQRSLALEVFTGSIEVQPSGKDAAPFQLKKGQRVVVKNDKVVEQAPDVEFVRYIPGGRNAPPELLGLYTFEGDARDQSGLGHDASAVANVQFVDSLDGRAARFAGNVDSYIDLPINVDPRQIRALTWGAWVRPQEVTRRHTILSSDNGGYDRMLTIDERSGKESAGPPQFAAHAGPDRGVLRSTSQVRPSPGAWRFVAAVYDDRRGTVTLFTEGDGPALHADVVGNARPGSGTEFVRVGMHAGGLSEPFAGEIDNVFIFRGGLTREQLEPIRKGGAAAVLQLNRHLAAGDENTEDGE